jgi:hypothetical protein
VSRRKMGESMIKFMTEETGRDTKKKLRDFQIAE